MDNKKVEADRGAVRYLMQALYSTIGSQLPLPKGRSLQLQV